MWSENYYSRVRGDLYTYTTTWFEWDVIQGVESELLEVTYIHNNTRCGVITDLYTYTTMWFEHKVWSQNYYRGDLHTQQYKVLSQN